MLFFGLLAFLKSFPVIKENELVIGMIFNGLLSIGLLGSPHIFWLTLCLKPMNESQTFITILVLIAFAISSWYFGFIPGGSRPSWGGEPHWEVPAAFIMEWGLACIAYVFFSFFNRES